MLPEQKQYRVLLADDHVLIRHGIKNIIKKDSQLEIVGEVSDVKQLMSFNEDSDVDLNILDI